MAKLLDDINIHTLCYFVFWLIFPSVMLDDTDSNSSDVIRANSIGTGRALGIFLILIYSTVITIWGMNKGIKMILLVWDFWYNS